MPNLESSRPPPSPSTWTLPCLPESSYATHEAARSTVNAYASRYGYAVVLKSKVYDKKTPRSLRRLVLGCDRHGTKRQHVSTCDPSKRRKSKSRRCGCLMEINLVKISVGGLERWHVQHRGTATVHNHPPSSGPDQHPILRKESRTQSAKQIIVDDFEKGLPVSHTVARITTETPGVIMTEADVRNERLKIAATLQSERTLQNVNNVAHVGAAIVPTVAETQVLTGQGETFNSNQVATSRDNIYQVGGNTTYVAESANSLTQLPSTSAAQRTWKLPCLSEASFDSPEAARIAINTFAARYGYAVVQKSNIYDKKTPPQPRRFILGCDRHGTKRQYNSTSSTPRPRKTVSRRCGCPMEVNLMRIQSSDGAAERWEVQHRGVATTHNHPPSSGPSEHPILRRQFLTDAVRRIIAADALAGVPVAKTLARIAIEAPAVTLMARDVYNERQKLLANPLEGELPPPTQVPQPIEATTPSSQSRVPLDLSGASVTSITVDSRPLVAITSTNGSNLASSLPDPSNSNVEQPRQVWMFPCVPELIFDSPEAARAAVNTFAARYGYAVVRKSTVTDKKKRPRRIVLACDRHGTKRVNASTCDPSKRRNKPSRKCNCPMEIHLVRILSSNGLTEQWQVQHRGTAKEHNHPPSEGPSAHPILRRDSRTSAARQIIAADAEAGIPVSETLARVAMETPGVVLTARDVRNVRQRIVADEQENNVLPTLETFEGSVMGPPTDVEPLFERHQNVGIRAQSGDFDVLGLPPDPTTMLTSEGNGVNVTVNCTNHVDNQQPSSIILESHQSISPAVASQPSSMDNECALEISRGSIQQTDIRAELPRQAWMLPCLSELFFDSPEAARAAFNTFAARHGYAVVHKSTVTDKKKQPRRIVLACDRHGTKRVNASTCDPSKRRNKPSRKCNCPMEVHLVRIQPSEGGRVQWQVQHRGTAKEHNHPPSEGPSAHPVLRRDSRTDIVRRIIAVDAEAEVPVSQTLARVAVEAPGVVITARDVQNMRLKIVPNAAED